MRFSVEKQRRHYQLKIETLGVNVSVSKKSAKSLNGVLLQDPHLHNHHALRDVANQNTSRLLDGKHCFSMRRRVRSLGREQSHTTKKMKKMKLSQSIKPSGWSNSHMSSWISQSALKTVLRQHACRLPKKDCSQNRTSDFASWYLQPKANVQQVPVLRPNV